jgi:hypothetical protein
MDSWWCQFHQHFIHDLFVQKFCEKLFCTHILGLNLFWCKSCSQNVGEIDPYSRTFRPSEIKVSRVRVWKPMTSEIKSCRGKLAATLRARHKGVLNRFQSKLQRKIQMLRLGLSVSKRSLIFNCIIKTELALK